MLQRVLLAYTSGLVAAVSPCVIVLIPLCLARFVRQDQSHPNSSIDAVTAQQQQLQEQEQGQAAGTDAGADAATVAPSTAVQSLPVQLVQFVAGFQLSYLVFGFALSSVLTSRVQDGFKLALGALFVTAAVLAAQGRVDPLRLPLARSAWWTGVSFALLLSFNPCTVPFLAALLSSADPAHTLLALLAFGNGLVTPAVLVVLVGARLLTWLEASAFQMERIKPLTHALLACSGLYLLMSPVFTMSAADLAVGLVGIALALVMVQSAAAKLPRQGAARVCSIAPDGQLTCQIGRSRSDGHNEATAIKRRKLVATLVATLLALILIGAALLYDHEVFTHTAVDNMFAEAAQLANPQMMALPSQNSSAVATAADNFSETGSVPISASGKLQQLKRQLISAASASTPTVAPSSAPLELDHLDQDALEVPHVLSDDEAAVAAVASPPLPTAGLQLSEADLLALQAVAAADAAADPAEIDRTCVDLSMLPLCFQCSLVVWLYRGAAMLVAAYAYAHDRIVALAFMALEPSESPLRMLMRAPLALMITRLFQRRAPKPHPISMLPLLSTASPVSSPNHPYHSPLASSPYSRRPFTPAAHAVVSL